MKSILLCGFMGCGKSTVGRILAQKMRLPLIDLDTSIEQAAGLPIPDFFAQQGEVRFRELETATLRAACEKSGQVIATGGGALLRPENVAVARAKGHVVYLHCPFAVCLDRIAHSDRPLVRQNTPAALEELYQRRLPLYRAACHLEAYAALTPEEVADAIRLSLELLCD